MVALGQFYERHGGLLSAIILVAVLAAWILLVIKTANVGRDRYGLRMILSWGMAWLLLGAIIFWVGAIFVPHECAPPCDLSLLGREHFEILVAAFALTAFIALALNIRKAGFLFGVFFTLIQASILIFAVAFIVVFARGDVSPANSSRFG